MRTIRIFVLISTSALALCGMAMIYMASIKGKFVPGVDLSQPRHPVTAEMAERVKKLDRKVGKFFKLPDTAGKPTLIGGQGPRPQFLYFVKKGCPCSFDAEPVMHKLYEHFAGKIDFIEVTDADMKDAKDWVDDFAKQNSPIPYPVVSNPKLDVMEAYQAPASVYSTLLDQNGLIVKRWAGYSIDYMKEMNAEISRLLGEPAKEFVPKDAPKNRTSGCSFEGYKETRE